ncbi:MAG: hypothetical protein RMY16_02365 [Nostoc sp. DedQUE12b]|uniref:hypothetical protein n=1 Tax=Nostoc sp. DedQUE12b TaxID=3075398 RepID=UPI002AD545BF|nr:hypothetical protein [Nostoc sp. DedQUE12b]MDZ8084428.1 hypothetical protein [Nostoc sp. DedQUE12b]
MTKTLGASGTLPGQNEINIIVSTGAYIAIKKAHHKLFAAFLLVRPPFGSMLYPNDFLAILVT